MATHHSNTPRAVPPKRAAGRVERFSLTVNVIGIIARSAADVAEIISRALVAHENA